MLAKEINDCLLDRDARIGKLETALTETLSLIQDLGKELENLAQITSGLEMKSNTSFQTHRQLATEVQQIQDKQQPTDAGEQKTEPTSPPTCESTESVNCDHCGELFQTGLGGSRRRNARFCSDRCRSDYHSSKRVQPRPEECPTCGHRGRQG